MANLLVLAMVAFFTKPAVGRLRICYKCADNTTCVDPVRTDDINTTDCLRQKYSAYVEDFVCIKLTLFNIEGNVYTGRLCVAKRFKGKEICKFLKRTVMKSGIAEVECHTCDFDLCNGSANVTASGLLLFVVFLSTNCIN